MKESRSRIILKATETHKTSLQFASRCATRIATSTGHRVRCGKTLFGLAALVIKPEVDIDYESYYNIDYPLVN